MKESAETIIKQIEIQIQDLLNIRAMFPMMTSEIIGQTEFQTAPFYQQKGFSITFKLSDPLTSERMEEINKIGRWVNQSFIIRLYALLESHHVIPPPGKGRMNPKLNGYEAVNIVHRLRKILAHTSGRYNPDEPEEKRLYETIKNTYSIVIGNSETPSEFPLPIDTLLLPLADGCKRYVQALYDLETSDNVA